MINFAAITPHPALLIQSIGKEKLEKLKETEQGMDDLSKKLDKAEIDTLVIISSSNKLHADSFGILLSSKYEVSFKDFGDLETKEIFYPDQELIEKIRHRVTDKELKMTLIHEEVLNYHFGIPLYLLAKNKKIKIIPIVHSYVDIRAHYELGKTIKTILVNTNKKIGIIASGNLSQRSNESSPLGFSPKGKEFNEKLVELLETKNTAGLLSLNEKLLKESAESITSSLAILLGVVDKINYKPQIFSNEAPLGVEYLVANLKLL